MSDRVDAIHPKAKHPAEVLGMAIVFADVLQTGETIESVTSIEADPADELTIDNEEPTASTILDDDDTPVAAGLAIVFRVAGGVAGKNYHVTATVETTFNGDPGNTRVGVAVLEVRSR